MRQLTVMEREVAASINKTKAHQKCLSMHWLALKKSIYHTAAKPVVLGSVAALGFYCGKTHRKRPLRRNKQFSFRQWLSNLLPLIVQHLVVNSITEKPTNHQGTNEL